MWQKRQSTAAVSSASLQKQVAGKNRHGGKHMPLEMLEARDRDVV